MQKKYPFRVMASSWDEVDSKMITQINKKTNKIANKIIAKSEKVKPGLKLKFIFSMMKSFQKNNDYAPLDKAYWKEKKWLGKDRPWKNIK